MTAQMIINMVDEIRNHGIEKVFKRYYGIYRAIVDSNEDKDGRGQIDVIVPTILGEKVLPTRALPKDFRGAGKGKGEFFPPDIGDGVWVEFEAGDLRFPVYSGGWFGENELGEDFAYKEGVPVSRGFQNKYGHIFRFDETKGEEKFVLQTPAGHFFVIDDTDNAQGIFLIHNTGAQLQIDDSGNLKIFGANGSFIYFNAEDDEITMTSKQGAYLSMTDEVKLSDATGQNWMTVNDGGVTMNAGGGALIQGNDLVANVGKVAFKDLLGSGLVIGNGQVALGSPVCEVVDSIIKIIDALTSGSPLVTTAVGPSSGLLPPALIQLLALKVLLTTLKGSLL